MTKGKKNFRGRASGVEGDLHTAARAGNLAEVKSLLSSNPLVVNNRDKHSRTPLHLAAWAGQQEIVSFLCKNKADVGAAAMDDMRPIHFAAQKGHLEVVKTLISHGASVKSATRKGLTSLHFAAQASNVDLVKYLLKKGANHTAKNKAGKTPSELASSDEIRLALQQSQCSTPPDPENAPSNDEEPNSKPSNDYLTVEGTETNKRKGEEKDENDDPEPKKAKVPLKHLIAEDDTED